MMNDAIFMNMTQWKVRTARLYEKQKHPSKQPTGKVVYMGAKLQHYRHIWHMIHDLKR